MNSNKESKIAEILAVLGSHGVCETGRRWLRGQDKTLATLVHVWRRWPEYLMEHYDFAVNEMREHLTEYELEQLDKERLYVDRKTSLGGLQFPHEPIFLLGDSDVRLGFESFGTAIIYCFGESRLEVSGDSSVILTIYLFGESHLKVDGKMTVRVYRHDEASIEGCATIVDREYKRGDAFNGEEREDYNIEDW